MYERFIIVKLGPLISDRMDQIKSTTPGEFFFFSPGNVVSMNEGGRRNHKMLTKS
jgi:hypothetical protein